jgi:hypothetical protein
MRKNLFFKICLAFIILWLFFFLYINRYSYYAVGNYQYKRNRISGEVYLLRLSGEKPGWMKVAD